MLFRSCSVLAAIPVFCGVNLCFSVNVVTYHNDLARTGQNLQEIILTQANVNSNTFGLLFTNATDGQMFTQPLYLSGVKVPGKGTRNLVFVATMHDSVYAFDADSKDGSNGGPIWHASFIDPANSIVPVPPDVYATDDPPEIGICGTPVIDPESGTLYVVARVEDKTLGYYQYFTRLYALDVATGDVKFGGPTAIEGACDGTGYGSVNGVMTFLADTQFQRPGLVLLNGVVYIGFGSLNDWGYYHGYLIAYDAKTLKQVGFLNTTPNTYGGSIWMSGAAPAADPEGNLYCITGDGTITANAGGKDYPDCFLKITPSGTNLVISDWFAPYNAPTLGLRSVDGDLGSGGAIVLPESVGSAKHRRLVFGGGKEGVLYLVDRDDMGHFKPNDNDQIVQSFQSYADFSIPAYFNGRIYYCGLTSTLKVFSISKASIDTYFLSQTPNAFGYAGVNPSISANGTNDAIVWVAERKKIAGVLQPVILRAYDAYDLGKQLYSSLDAGTRDQAGTPRQFLVPTVVNGKVYVSTDFGLAVFGLLSAKPPLLTLDHDFSLTLEGTAGSTYSIEMTTDAGSGWTECTRLTLTNNQQTISGLVESTNTPSFFRAVRIPSGQ